MYELKKLLLYTSDVAWIVAVYLYAKFLTPARPLLVTHRKDFTPH